MTHPHQAHQDHSRDADDIFDEIRTLMRGARANAENALRTHAWQRQRRRARQQYSFPTRHHGAEPLRTTHSSHARFAAGLTEDLMARWAGAHAAATVAREEADIAKRENAAGDAATAQAEEAALRAEAWADAWDERVRHAGLDPDTIGRADPASYTEDYLLTDEYPSAPRAPEATTTEPHDPAQAWEQSQSWAIVEGAAHYAEDIAYAMHEAPSAPPGVGALLADTRPSPQADLLPATDLSGPGQLDVGEAIGLDTGASL